MQHSALRICCFRLAAARCRIEYRGCWTNNRFATEWASAGGKREMQNLRRSYYTLVDERIRDSLWALRARGDTSVLSAVVRGRFSWRYKPADTSDHLEATMAWLCAAQDAIEGGVAAFYDLRAGAWGPAYPETTGYIIPSFYDYAAVTGDDTYRSRAEAMAKWLLPLQLEDGGFPIGPLWPEWERVPVIFDTGQIVQGLVRTFQETGDKRYLDAAQRAGRWLIGAQDEDGCWRQYNPSEKIQTYNVRASWALVQLSIAAHDDKFGVAAHRNLEWALSQQDADGWFRNSSFRRDEDPLVHTIAYTIEGLLEAGDLLGDGHLVTAAQKGADALLVHMQEDGFLRGRYGPAWRSDLGWSCLTGDAQMAAIWLRLFELTGEGKYVDAAAMAIRFVKQTQNRTSRLPGLMGGIAGSCPVYCEYEPYRYLNWAAKFFLDSLLLQSRLQPLYDSVSSSAASSSDG